MIEIFNRHYARATYNTDYKCIEVVWHSNQTFEEYKLLFTRLLEFQRNSGFEITGYLSDITDQGIVSPESRKWFENVALPTAVSQGLKYAAVVFDASVFKKYYLNLILQIANVYRLQMKVFNSVEEARQWLKDIENAKNGNEK